MGSRLKTRPRSSSQRAPDRMPDLLLPSSDQQMSDTARQMQEINDRRAAIAEESRRLDEKESSLSKNPLIRRLTSARSSVRKSKDALNAQLKEMDEEERRINAQLEREKMRAVEVEDEEDEQREINDDELAKAETILLRRGRVMRNSVRRKSVTDLDTIREEREDLQREQKENYAHEAGAWRSRVCELIGQIAARPTSFFLFKQVKNDDMPKLEEKLFCFAVKFVDQDRLAAEEDLQLRALYLMWKEFKEVVDNMEKRMMQSVDLETEEVAVEADCCTDESSGDETESTLAPTETTDSESQAQRACDYAREAEDFKRRVDQIMEEISAHPSSPPVDVSLHMLVKIKQVELPALSTSLGRLLDIQAECDDDDLQWGSLKSQWTRLRDVVDTREKELKELCENQQNTSHYAEEAERFRSGVNQITELITSSGCSHHNEALTVIRRIKREDLPALEQHLDRLLELLMQCNYDGQQWPFETLVQEFTQLINNVKTREFQLLEQISKKLHDEDSREENYRRHDEARSCEEESEEAEQNVVRWRPAEDHNGTGEDQSQENQSQFERQSTRLSFHRRLHSEMEQTFKKKGMAAAAEVDEEEEKRKSRPFDINREIEEEMMRSLAVKEMRVRMEEDKIENEKKTAKIEFDMMRERWEELKRKRMEENKLEEEEMRRLEEEKKKRIEEENLKKEEEDMNRRIEEEKMKRMEEERRKKEEEGRIRVIEEEKMKRLEAEKRKKEVEERDRRIEEEKMKRLEAEKRKKEVEERDRRIEEEKMKRMEEERRKKEEEGRIRVMEEEKMKKLEGERRKKEEEERIRMIEDEKMKRLEEERRKKEAEEMRSLEEEKEKRIEEDKRKKEEEESNKKIEEEKMKRLEEEKNKKEEEENIKNMMELEKRKNDQAEKIKRLDEEMKKKKEEIARVQKQLLERQKAAMDQKKEEEARRRCREEKRLMEGNQQVERQVDRARDPSQQHQLLQHELQQKLQTTSLGKAVAAEIKEEEDRERKRRDEMRRKRDKEERKRAELEPARRKNEDRRGEAEQLNSTRHEQNPQSTPATSPTSQRQQDFEKKIKEMEKQAMERLAAEMAALKKAFGFDGADGVRAGSVGERLRRTVSDEQLPQQSANTTPINTAPPATISHDPRSSLRAGVRERTPLNRAASRPRSVTFCDAQGSENVIAELTRSPSFRRMRAAHASEDESEPEHQQSRF